MRAFEQGLPASFPGWERVSQPVPRREGDGFTLAFGFRALHCLGPAIGHRLEVVSRMATLQLPKYRVNRIHTRATRGRVPVADPDGGAAHQERCERSLQAPGEAVTVPWEGRGGGGSPVGGSCSQRSSSRARGPRWPRGQCFRSVDLPRGGCPEPWASVPAVRAGSPKSFVPAEKSLSGDDSDAVADGFGPVVVVADGTGGAYILLVCARRSGDGYGRPAQRYDALGRRQWPAGDLPSPRDRGFSSAPPPSRTARAA